MADIRIALAQINTTVGALSENRRKIAVALERARKKDADIIVFPELAVCGYPPEDLFLKKHFINDVRKTTSSLKKETRDIAALIGSVDQGQHGRAYNSAVLFSNKTEKYIYHKQSLPNYSVFDEERYFVRGNEKGIFYFGSLKCGISVCEDLWDEDGVWRVYKQESVRLIFNLSASPFHMQKRAMREKLICQRARTLGAYVCYCNLVGGQDELVFDGGSFIAHPRGEIIIRAKQLEEDMVYCDIPFSEGRRTKRISKNIITIPYREKKRKLIVQRQDKPLSRREEIYSALALGTRDYVKKNGFEKVVIGLSGGVDSALVAAIACDALGKQNVVGVSMPSRFSSSGTQRDAERLSKNLGIRFLCIPIHQIYESFLRELKPFFESRSFNETEENIQARIRGMLLMALSNKHGWLVLTTGNKSETAVGYCTLYGDMAGGFAVIKDVSKTCVYELARCRNQREKKKCIPQSIITRAPSAELRKGQKDQDSLPPYNMLDTILKAYIEEDKSYDQIVRTVKKRKVVQKIITLVDRNEYKRRQAPPGIKITPKAFGRDRRFPITNQYRIQ